MARKRNITTMSEMGAGLMQAFNAINKHFYNGELEKPIITVKEGKKKNAYGWIETSKNWIQGKTERYEINISCDYIGERTVAETISTLMHEMAHLYNIQNEIKDTSRAGIYHNTKFKETAEAHGLQISYNEHIGWSLTRLTEETEKWVDENINIKGFSVYKLTKEKISKGTAKPKQSMRKLVCPCCGLIARVTKPNVKLLCVKCNEELKEE
ncbi:MAG: SprT-like domain-containing protein [[Eubacterium] siraeum]